MKIIIIIPKNEQNYHLEQINFKKQKKKILLFEILIGFSLAFPVGGSLPPSPADSGVSDVDSSSGHTSNDESKTRLHLTGTSRQLLHVAREIFPPCVEV